MIQIKTIDDLFPALDELVTELKTSGHSRLAAILHHRLHKVAWTTRCELFEEIAIVFNEALDSDHVKLQEPLKKTMRSILAMIGERSRAKGV